MSRQLARRWFTVGEYNRMAEAGILAEDDRVELIEGEIVEMSPIGSRHAACVNRLNTLLSSHAKQSYIVSVQNPIVLGDYSVPEPDIALLRLSGDFYSDSLPVPADVLLLVEVAETSIGYDRDIKVPLYGRSGIAECLLVDLRENVIECYAHPINGKYESVKVIKRGESFTSQVVSGLEVSAANVLG